MDVPSAQWIEKKKKIGLPYTTTHGATYIPAFATPRTAPRTATCPACRPAASLFTWCCRTTCLRMPVSIIPAAPYTCRQQLPHAPTGSQLLPPPPLLFTACTYGSFTLPAGLAYRSGLVLYLSRHAAYQCRCRHGWLSASSTARLAACVLYCLYTTPHHARAIPSTVRAFRLSLTTSC